MSNELRTLTHIHKGIASSHRPVTGTDSGSKRGLDVALTSMEYPTKDAFGRMRVSNGKVLYHITHVYDNNQMLMDQLVVGGASIAHDSDESAMIMSLGTASGDRAVYQTYEYIPYTPGNSHTAMFTAVFGVGSSASSQRIGLFDDDNGVFFEQKNQQMGVVIRSKVTGSVVDNRIEQSDWSHDTMDGSGDANNPSGILLDLTNTQIGHISYEWLGVGSVFFSIIVDGVIHLVHAENNANQRPTIYMQRGSLPVRYEVENTGATTATSDFRAICTMVMSEGDATKKNILNSVTNGISTVALSTTLRPIISIRLKSAFNRALLELISFQLQLTTNDDYELQLLMNPTLTGASFADITGSIAQRDVSATAVSGGTIISAGYGNKSTSPISVKSDELIRRLASDIAGTTQDVFTIAGRVRTGTGSGLGSITFKEIF